MIYPTDLPEGRSERHFREERKFFANPLIIRLPYHPFLLMFPELKLGVVGSMTGEATGHGLRHGG